MIIVFIVNFECVQQCNKTMICPRGHRNKKSRMLVLIGEPLCHSKNKLSDENNVNVIVLQIIYNRLEFAFLC
jgi:hypothetical protein